MTALLLFDRGGTSKRRRQRLRLARLRSTRASVRHCIEAMALSLQYWRKLADNMKGAVPADE
jgi:hypothetical protein